LEVEIRMRRENVTSSSSARERKFDNVPRRIIIIIIIKKHIFLIVFCFGSFFREVKIIICIYS